MAEVVHQFANRDFYKPYWRVKYLFIGTFNPKGGKTVNYYYGRQRNQFWKLLSEIMGMKLEPNDKEEFFERIKDLGIACMDMIHSVELPDSKLEYVKGKGYSDVKIINGYSKREYNTELINSVVERNQDVKVFSTWGKGPNLKEWRCELSKLNRYTKLVSPSMAAKVPKDEIKFDYMLRKWKETIDI